MADLPRKVATRLEHTGHAPSDRAQRMAQQVGQAHEQTKAFVTSLPFTNGWALVTGLVFGAGVAQDVTHGLNSTSVGYIEVRRYGTNVSNVVGESGTAPADPLNQVQLITTLATRRDILFFVL